MTAHSAAASLWIPDLLLEVASHLSDLADISGLSKCDRMSREMIMPLLFYNISIPLQKAASVAYVLGKYPHYARRCRSFRFEGSSVLLTPRQCKPLFVSLAAVLHTLGVNAHVKSVWWYRRVPVNRNMAMVVPTHIWQALATLSGSLEELHIYATKSQDNWYPILTPEYPRLRVLDVWLENVHRWDLSPLQVMLNGLFQLEDLRIQFSDYETGSGLDLSSYHPRLRTLSFTGERLPPSFLNRHSTIECLRIDVDCTDSLNLGDHDLPHLKVLRVDGTTISHSPSLFSPSARRPITHLRLDNVEYTDILFVAESTRATLRHLEIGCSIEEFRRQMLLFQHFSQLEELRLVFYSIGAVLLCEEDLVKVLLCLSDFTNIAHLKLFDFYSPPLSEPFLGDIGSVPASLEYLTWNTVTYRLEPREGKTVAVRARSPYSREDILDLDLVLLPR